MGDWNGEAKVAARASKGRETIDMNEERGKGEQNGRKYIDNITTNSNQWRSAKRREQTNNGTGRGGTGGGGRAGAHPDPGVPLSLGGLQR